MRRRFFVEGFIGQRAVLEGEAAHHLGRVLRAARGQQYELSDGSAVWLGEIEDVRRDAVTFRLVETIAARESSLRMTLLLAIVKFDRFEWALEKATELGVDAIVPLAAARSEKALIAAAEKRRARWQRILLESAQQSRRVRLPALESAIAPREAFAAASIADASPLRVMLSERADAPLLRDAVNTVLASATPGCKTESAMASAAEIQPAFASCALAIGPEGGWTDDERAAARAAGFREASLGPHILRTETAVIAGLASLRFAAGV